MPRLRALPRAAVAACSLALAAPAAGRAQLAGSARVALAGSTARLDGGDFNNYALSGGVFPFVSEHVQLGLAPGFQTSTSTGGPAFHGYNLEGTANYVFGGGGRWRGYAGAFAARTWQRTTGSSGGGFTVRRSTSNFSEVGGQAGALFFVDPALAVRAEVQYRGLTSIPGARGTLSAVVRLDPYLFGRAADAAPALAGLGVVDVDGYVSRYDPLTYRSHTWSARVLAAPYLTRWAQVGVDAQGVVSSEGGGTYGTYRSYTTRGFGRLYLPLTARTQPFAEGSAAGGGFRSGGFDLFTYAGALGVRQMLNARVALDVGVRRLVPRRHTLDDGTTYRGPGQTGLVLGLATRVGRAR